MNFMLDEFLFNSSRNLPGQRNFFLIAGPCVIESEQMCLEHAQAIKDICKRQSLEFIFKSSYDKANRTSINSFRGPGVRKGIKILTKLRKQLKIPITSDVHSVDEIQAVSEILDIIQIPALLSRQTDLILAAAKTKKIINVKKGQFMAPADMRHVINKIESRGNKKIILTERGTCFGYHNLVSDMRSIPIMKRFGYPVVFDATHSAQLPSSAKDKSSGDRIFVETLALSAVAAGCDGLFLEVHKTPDKALCDGPNMISLKDLERLLRKAKQLRKAIYE